MLYGRVIKDHLPVLQDKYQTQKQWKEIRELREVVMAKRHMRNEQFYNKHCCPLWELQIKSTTSSRCTTVMITTLVDGGRVVETYGNRQYLVRGDGSNRTKLHNRRFLRKIYPVVDGPKCYTPKISDPPPNSESPRQKPPEEAMDTERDANVVSSSVQREPEVEEMEVDDASGATEGNIE